MIFKLKKYIKNYPKLRRFNQEINFEDEKLESKEDKKVLEWKNSIPSEIYSNYLKFEFGKELSDIEIRMVFSQFREEIFNYNKLIHLFYEKINYENECTFENYCKNNIENKILIIFFPLFKDATIEFKNYLNTTNFTKSNIDKIHTQFCINLYQQLFGISSKTLVLELNVAKVNNKLENDNGFDSYIELLQNFDYIKEIIAEYPILFRLVITKIVFWFDNSKSIIGRLNKDFDSLLLKFKIETRKINSFEFGKSDLHNNGQSVIIVNFDNNKRIVYKPRDLEVDIVFQKFCYFLNLQTKKVLFPRIILINKRNYGWVEFINHRQKHSELKEYYYRYGATIAIVYILKGSDFHFENLIANERFPHLVDLECLFRQKLLNKEAIPVLDLETVSDSFLLPTFIKSVSGKVTDISALNLLDDNDSNTIIIDELGTERMRFIQKIEKSKFENTNIPYQKGSTIDLINFENDILSGFDIVYKAFLEKKNSIFEIINKHKKIRTRVLLRHTEFYTKLIGIVSHPNNLRDNIIFDTKLNILLNYSNLYNLDILDYEKKSIMYGDVPFFSTHLDSKNIFLGNKSINFPFFKKNNFESFNIHVDTLTLDDLKRQKWILSSKLTLIKTPKELYKFDIRNNFNFDKNDIKTIKSNSNNKILKACQKIAKDLMSKVFVKDQMASWFEVIPQENEENFDLGLMDSYLYNGLAGIALFFGSIFHVTNKKKYKFFLDYTLNSIEYQIDKEKNGKLGVFDGLGGIVYLYFLLGRILFDENYIEKANFHLNKLKERLNDLDEFDVISGAAGLIKLFYELQIRGYGNFNDEFIKLGIIIEKKKKENKYGLFWSNQENFFLGYAHGNSGIIPSLVILNIVLNESKWLYYAEEALKFETFLYKSEIVSHIDENLIKPQPFYWCNGETGYGFMKLLLIKMNFQNDLSLNEIKTIVENTLEFGISSNFSLCHGALGNLDFLFQVAENSPDSNLSSKIEKYIHLISISILNDKILTGSMYNLNQPNLMTGTSGIGYQLLRFLKPSVLPSILVTNF